MFIGHVNILFVKCPFEYLGSFYIELVAFSYLLVGFLYIVWICVSFSYMQCKISHFVACLFTLIMKSFREQLFLIQSNLLSFPLWLVHFVLFSEIFACSKVIKIFYYFYLVEDCFIFHIQINNSSEIDYFAWYQVGIGFCFFIYGYLTDQQYLMRRLSFPCCFPYHTCHKSSVHTARVSFWAFYPVPVSNFYPVFLHQYHTDLINTALL